MSKFPSVLIWGIALSLLWSSAGSLPLYADSLPSQESLQASDLKQKYPETEIVMLKDGEQQVLALHKMAMTPFVKGTVVLLPDGSKHAAAARAIDPLRQDLVDYGWHTLSVMMPAYDGLTGDDTDAIYLKQLQTRIAAAIAQAKQQPGAIILVAQGHSGAVVNQLLAQNLIEQPQALVLVGAMLREPTAELASIKAMSDHKVPTLDILQSSDGDHVLNSLRTRAQWTRKQIKELYRQRYWPEDSALNDVWLQKEVLGWLRYIGF